MSDYKYYSREERDQISSAIERSMMSSFADVSENDPSLVRLFKKNSIPVGHKSVAILFGKNDVAYAAAKFSIEIFKRRNKKPQDSTWGQARVFNRAGFYGFEASQAPHAVHCIRSVPNLRKGTSVVYWSENMSMGVDEIESRLMAIMNLSVNALVVDSVGSKLRLDDGDSDPEEEGGMGFRYFKESDMGRLGDLVSPHWDPGFVSDAYEMKTRWVKTTFLKLYPYMSGKVTIYDGSRRPFSRRVLALEFSGGEPGRDFMHYVDEIENDVENKRIIHGIIEGDRILSKKEYEASALFVMSYYAQDFYNHIINNFHGIPFSPAAYRIPTGRVKF